MKARLAVGVALLTACGGYSGPSQSEVRAREERARARITEVAGEVAGGETSEFSGGIGIGACEIASSEPLDLSHPEVASWAAMAQGHHEQTLGWRRLVQSDDVTGFAEHTSVSIDVNVPGGRDIVYGSGGYDELSFCDGLRGRQIELEITLATADGAVAGTFRSWFEPGPTDDRGMVLGRSVVNAIDLNGTLELGLDPVLGGRSQVDVTIEFGADSVRGSLSPAVFPEDDTSGWAPWWPLEAYFPDDPCGSQGHSIGLDEPFGSLIGTPRATLQRMARTTRWRERIPAVWKKTPYLVVPTEPDVPIPTDVSMSVGEPVRACAVGTSVTVYAPLTVTSADGRVNLTQPFSFNIDQSSAYIVERTPWVPAADFNEHIGIDGVNLESGYGSLSFVNSVNWQYGWAEGALEVTQWDAFTDEFAGYPVLEWCRAAGCVPATE